MTRSSWWTDSPAPEMAREMGSKNQYDIKIGTFIRDSKSRVTPPITSSQSLG
jgi:hypothetical protein